MNPLFIILSLLLVVDSVILVVVILLQKKRASGLSGTVAGMGGSASGSTYWDQNKGRSREGMLERYTKYSAIVFFVLSFALGFVR